MLGVGAGLLFAVGFAMGQLIPPNTIPPAAEEADRSADPIRIPSENDARTEIPEEFHRLRGASNSAFIDELERCLDGKISEAQLLALALRWVMEDAEGGAAHLFGLIGDDENEERYGDIFEAFLFVWAKQDLQALAGYVKRLEQQGHPLAEDLAEIIEEEGGRGGEAAIEFLSGLEPDEFDSQNDRTWQAINKLAEANPRAAAEILEKFRGIHRTNAIDAVARIWAESDPVAALEWVEGLDASGDRKRGLESALIKAAQSDLAAAMDCFGRHQKDLIGSSAAHAIIHEIAKDDPKRALLWYHEQIEAAGDGAALGLNPWNQRNVVAEMVPRGASQIRAFLDGIPEGKLRSSITQALSFERRIDLTSSPRDFLDEIGEMPADQLRGTLLSSGLRAWIAQDAQTARDAVLQFDGPLRSVAALQILGADDAFASAEEAFEFAKATGVDADAIGAGMGSVMWGWSDISSAADFFSTATDVGKNSGAAHFVAAWAKKSPEDALRWIGDRPGEKTELIGKAVSGWLQADPQAASEWALELEDPAARAASAVAVSQAMLYADPEASFVWALEVSAGSGERDELVRQAYLAWKGRDQAAADEALGREGVPQELRDIFLEQE